MQESEGQHLEDVDVQFYPIFVDAVPTHSCGHSINKARVKLDNNILKMLLSKGKGEGKGARAPVKVSSRRE